MTEGLVTLGESLVALRATDSGTARMGDLFELDVVGAESNVAVGVARLGGRARFIGRVGNDDAGRAIERALRGEGVELDLTIDSERPTGLLFATSPSPGRSRVSYRRADSAGSRLSTEDLDIDAIASAGVLHVTGITCALSATSRTAVEAAVTIAKRHGVLVSLDINYRSKLWSREQAREVLRPLAPRTDILFAGVDEAQLLLGPGGQQRGNHPGGLAQALQEVGAATVVITDGPNGAWLLSADGSSYQQPALPASVINSAGAGDAFVAGFLADTLDGAPIADRLRTAVACGARACESRGDWRNAPTRDELITSHSSTASDPVER